MSRKIKFRGQCLISGELVYGDVIHGVGSANGKIYILPRQINLAYVKHCHPLDGVQIKPETISQFTCLYDKNGKEIYHGDILSDFIETDQGYIKSHCQVFWNENTCQFCLDLSFKNNKKVFEPLSTELRNYSYEISGNIYQNPELLSVQ